jgi:hypothetical protein
VLETVLAGSMLTFTVLRASVYRGVDRPVVLGLTALVVVLVLSTGVGRDDFSVGYCAMGFMFGAALHAWLPTRRDPSPYTSSRR